MSADDAERTAYLEVTQEAGRAFVLRGIAGPIAMLNLLRYRETADYAAHPEAAPSAPVSGADAFRRYYDETLPLLRAKGGDVLFFGTADRFLIGPSDEAWSAVMLVRHRSVEAFLSFATDGAYLPGTTHRTAALLDSRLLPVIEGPV